MCQWSGSKSWWMASILLAAGVSGLPAGDAGTPDSPIELGRRIFEHNFSQPETWRGKQPLGAGGDGLGPQFNDVSCVACHRQGGVGGAGPQSKNVRVLSYRPANNLSLTKLEAVARRASQFHPDLSLTVRSTPLHSFHLPRPNDRTSYEEHLAGLFDELGLSLDQTVPQRRVLGDAIFEISQRNTAAVWGMGAIEALRRQEGNGIREHLIEDQNRKYSWLSGRSPRTPANEKSWFGWRGQTVGLHQFTLGACATEMGLTVSGMPQHRSAADSLQQQNLELDLTDHQALALTAFVASLPQPQQILPNEVQARERVALGEQVFNNCHCNACHVRDLGPLTGIYSDLALHDMGPDDCDMMMANPEILDGEVITGSVTASYYTAIVTLPTVTPPKTKPTNCECEWKTPPLWGCADSAPYLHDGRAATLDEAIQWHGGEGLTSRNLYQQLPPDERSLLLEFLQTLRAPQEENPSSSSPLIAVAATPMAASQSNSATATAQPAAPQPQPQPLPAVDAVAVALPALPPLVPATIDATAAEALRRLCLELKPGKAAVNQAIQLGQTLESELPEPGAADYAVALFLERSHQHSEAVTRFRQVSELTGGLAIRARQVLILDELRNREFAVAITSLERMAKFIGDDSTLKPRDAAEAVQWLGIVSGWLTGPSGLDATRYQIEQALSRVEETLSDELRPHFKAGVQQVQTQVLALQAERSALSGLEAAEIQSKQGELTQQREDLSSRQKQAEKSQAEAKTALDEALAQIDPQLLELEKQYAEHDGVDQQLGARMAPLQFRSAALVTSLAQLTPSRGSRAFASAMQGELTTVNAELNLLGKQREENQTKLRLVLIKAKQLTTERSNALAAYQRATGKAAQELQSLSKWQDRFSKQAAKLDDAASGSSRRTQLMDRRIRDLVTYVRFDADREAQELVNRYRVEE